MSTMPFDHAIDGILSPSAAIVGTRIAVSPMDVEEVRIFPSTSDGYFFCDHIQLSTGNQVWTTRPIIRSAIRIAMQAMGIDPARFDWRPVPCEPSASGDMVTVEGGVA